MPTAGDTSLGTIILFSGRISDTEVSRTMAKITVKSELELLNTQLPRNLFQAGCLHTLFDNGCQLNKANYAVAGTVVNGSKTSINTTLGQGSDYFTLGTVKFTSGVNAGVARSVRYYANGSFVFALPLVTAPSAGDTFLAYPGCDKQQGTCSGKYGNLVNFRGFPYVPVPETAQ